MVFIQEEGGPPPGGDSHSGLVHQDAAVVDCRSQYDGAA